jgi:uncharacterized protein YdeI (YjbR/CyaY-like superfamily)
MNTAAKILQYLEKNEKWKNLLYDLREIILSTHLEEKVKWGMPVYCKKNKNIVGIGAFKGHAGMWFFQGSLLSDPEKVLTNAQEGKTSGMRHWKFTNPLEPLDKHLIRQYILESIKHYEEGRKAENIKKKIVIPDELAAALEDDKMLNIKFKKLSFYKQKEYFEYIGSAKRSDTKKSRLAKSIQLILKGKGLNDKYKK